MKALGIYLVTWPFSWIISLLLPWYLTCPNELSAASQSSQTREGGTSKITICYYSSPWEMACLALVKAEPRLPLPSFPRWRRQNLQACDHSQCDPCNHRTTAAQLTKYMPAKPHCKTGLKNPKWTETPSPIQLKKREASTGENFKVRTGTRNWAYQLFCSCLLFWSVTQQKKGFCLHGETESILHRKWQKSTVWNVTRALFASMGNFPGFRETANHPPCST